MFEYKILYPNILLYFFCSFIATDNLWRFPNFKIRVQKKIFVGLGVLQFFTTRQWNFRSDNFKAIYENLSAEEKVIFNMNTEEVDQVIYLKHCILGGRQYCLKEPNSSLPKARIQLKM